MIFTLAELTRIKLEPGEVLSVKLIGDECVQSDLSGLKSQLQKFFPDNKIMVFSLPSGNDLQMEVISVNLENNENTEDKSEKLE